MSIAKRIGGHIGWLELLLGFAILSLFAQIFPERLRNFWLWLLYYANFRDWSATTWVVLNCLFLILLMAIYFRPAVVEYYRSYRENVTRARTESLRIAQVKAEKETLRRTMEARKRRIY
jgi:hypothetical protein